MESSDVFISQNGSHVAKNMHCHDSFSYIPLSSLQRKYHIETMENLVSTKRTNSISNTFGVCFDFERSLFYFLIYNNPSYVS